LGQARWGRGEAEGPKQLLLYHQLNWGSTPPGEPPPHAAPRLQGTPACRGCPPAHPGRRKNPPKGC